MSIRESRLCDSPRGYGADGDLCCLPADATYPMCPVCQQDRCVSHMGYGAININVEERRSQGPEVVKLHGRTSFRVCDACLKLLKPEEGAFTLDAGQLIKPLCALIAAEITADALETKTP